MNAFTVSVMAGIFNLLSILLYPRISIIMQAADLFGLLIDTWSDRLDSVSNIQYRKLTGLAIANLLPIADP